MGGWSWSNLKNYSLWTLVFSLLLAFGEQYKFITNITGYNQLVQTFLVLLVLGGLINAPVSIKNLMTGKYGSWGSFLFDLTSLLNMPFLQALIAFIPMFMLFIGVSFNTAFFTQVALIALAILSALHLVSGSSTSKPAPVLTPEIIREMLTPEAIYLLTAGLGKTIPNSGKTP